MLIRTCLVIDVGEKPLAHKYSFGCNMQMQTSEKTIIVALQVVLGLRIMSFAAVLELPIYSIVCFFERGRER